MTKGKKYDYKITQEESTWRAEITRQVTSRKSTVSKCQSGFATEGEAQAWGKEQLAVFLENQKEKNKRNAN